MTLFKDRQGDEIPLLTWAKLYEDDEYRQVALDKVSTTWVVSTIWEGMVLPWREGIFETALILDGNILDVYRASTEEEALANHQRLVQTGREDNHVEDR